MVVRILSIASVVSICAACGGSGSETPPPVEPVSPKISSQKSPPTSSETVEQETQLRPTPSSIVAPSESDDTDTEP
ncbi:MAG TPA: hypothetical protein PKL73_12550 [Polyangiaceae bacterium]|nr:hypothetical protein [Polyangiaceae bacterium]HNZ25223.1 hypothetical protein [Polyangiaceae bacterium]HOD25104.1 hypothetical protein [Polyangiaceae bacterium]HOE51830.1 hypothetical protein [Polyangiaceae bacterium]HOH03574.1 hypothetical protein [Polyangiaceae bacterium]